MNDYEHHRGGSGYQHESYDVDAVDSGNSNMMMMNPALNDDDGPLFTTFLGGDEMALGNNIPDIDFDDPQIAALPRVLLMGPRRGGKTSILVCTPRSAHVFVAVLVIGRIE